MNKAFLQVILNAYETQYGTLEEIHSHRNELITKVEKESSSYLIKQIVKEIRQYEGLIEKYISLYINIDREIPPEIIEYKTYTNINEQPENEAGEDSEKFTGAWTGTKIELVNDLRSDKETGIYKTYAEAYQHAEENITVNGKPVKAKNLESLYYKTQSTNKRNV